MDYSSLWTHYSIPRQPTQLLILGAGYSAATIPTMPDLATLSAFVERELGDQKFGESSWRTWKWETQEKDMDKIGGLPPVNVEDILGHCFATRNTEGVKAITSAIARIIGSVDTSKPSEVSGMLSSLISKIPGTKIVVSFNYDTILEDSLGWQNYGATWRYASPLFLDSSETFLISDAPDWHKNHSSAFQPEVRPENCGIVVLKPHGSLNWVQYSDRRGRNLIVAGKRCFAGVVEDYLDKGWDFSPHQSGFTSRRTVITPPMPQKYIGPDITFYHFRLMLEGLRRADLMSTIGWSCPISDQNLLNAFEFQFWDRMAPLRELYSCWRTDDPAVRYDLKSKFQRMFPTPLPYHCFSGFNTDSCRELAKLRGIQL